MQTVELFFQSMILFLVIVSLVTITISVATTVSAWRQTRKTKGGELGFNMQGFMLAFILPLIYVLSVGGVMLLDVVVK